LTERNLHYIQVALLHGVSIKSMSLVTQTAHIIVERYIVVK